MSRDRLLIIETDDLIRELLVRWLAEAGHLVASDDSRPETIALVIVDIPNPAKPEATLRRVHHGAPILAISGRFRRGSAASENAARQLGVAKVLSKPFTCEEFLAAVGECLGSR